MKKLFTILLTSAICFFLTQAANAQTTTADYPACPSGLVCITRQAALKALQDADKVTALETEAKALKAAIEEMRELLNKARVEFAAVSGENTALKQNAVSDRAIIELLLKNSKKKCMPFSIICI